MHAAWRVRVMSSQYSTTGCDGCFCGCPSLEHLQPNAAPLGSTCCRALQAASHGPNELQGGQQRRTHNSDGLDRSYTASSQLHLALVQLVHIQPTDWGAGRLRCPSSKPAASQCPPAGYGAGGFEGVQRAKRPTDLLVWCHLLLQPHDGQGKTVQAVVLLMLRGACGIAVDKLKLWSDVSAATSEIR
jgi:hypothetical protein